MLNKAKKSIFKLELKINQILVVTALFYTFYYNFIFIKALTLNGVEVLKLVFVILMLVSLNIIFFIPFSFRIILKPFLYILFISSSAAFYFMKKYGIYIDKSMIGNLFETDFREAVEFVNISFIREIFISGIIPCLVLLSVKIKKESFKHAFTSRLKLLFLSFTVFIFTFLITSSQIIPLMREKHHLRYLIVPSNYISSVFKYFSSLKTQNRGKEKIASDAVIVKKNNEKNKLLILIVGESVRAKNWGLDGYERNTTPEISKLKNVFNFKNVVSCGTDTKTSLPCMFSFYGRKNYSERKIRNTESVFDIFARTGIEVYWLDNQSGDKGVAKNAKHVELKRSHLLCKYDRCFDEVLVETLKDLLPSVKSDAVIILHMLGNHGPAYFKRYPDRFEVFKPACKNEDLSKCKRSEIINAYDNVILYTDYLISRTIKIIEKNKDFDTALFYISDHGESLGEKNIYLHGIPYYIAPDEQKKIPFIIWFSDKMIKKYEKKCIENITNDVDISHDNLFHLLLGFFDIKTSVYDSNMDFLSVCRKK